MTEVADGGATRAVMRFPCALFLLCACTPTTEQVGSIETSGIAIDSTADDDDHTGGQRASSTGADEGTGGTALQECDVAQGDPLRFTLEYPTGAGFEPQTARRTLACTVTDAAFELDCTDVVAGPVTRVLDFPPAGLVVGQSIVVDEIVDPTPADGLGGYSQWVAIRDAETDALLVAGWNGSHLVPSVDQGPLPWEPELAIAVLPTDCPDTGEACQLGVRDAVQITIGPVIATLLDGQHAGVNDHDLHVARAFTPVQACVDGPSAEYVVGVALAP